MSITITRTSLRLLPDPRRVIAKPYLPGEEIAPSGELRAQLLMKRVLAIPETDVARLLQAVLDEFAARHENFVTVLDRHFELASRYLPEGSVLSTERRLLIGAYFSHEYSVEGAALLNPSIVWAADQSGLAPGEKRFILSLRAVGEGHISSIEFRSGVSSEHGELRIDAPGEHLLTGVRTTPESYDKVRFEGKLAELGVLSDLALQVLNRLATRFTRAELEQSIAFLEQAGPTHAVSFETAKIIRVLAASHYVTTFPASSAVDERILFPAGPHETHGMEDARFVLFTHDDGSLRYYATYTAYDGFEILPQIIETADFLTFRISTLHGSAAQNKGMALFPRKIDGKYVMLSRKDRENLHLATSNDVHAWESVTELHRPSAPWELLQIGNCGSPLETAAGWLVLTHGVGPMRRYVLGALLLDLNDPAKVLGHLAEPLMQPDASEREGYVPNVLYTCGAIIHGDRLVLPYGFSDNGVGVAHVSLPELLAALLASGK